MLKSTIHGLGALMEQFTYEDMKGLCTELNIGSEELFLRGKSEFSRLLPARMYRRGHLADLISVTIRMRPDLFV
jgi:hypothetical protein